MRETIAINGLTLCHKHSDGWVRSTLPDVCKSPTIPKPYTNVAFARDLAKGTTTVFSHGGAMNGVKGSEFHRSFGDEPGVGGGVISGVNLHRATFLSWSPNVFMEGRHVTRLTDRMLLNKGNTISAGGYYTGSVEGKSYLLDPICEKICECVAEKTPVQRCVENKINGDQSLRDKGVYAEQGFQAFRSVDGSISSWLMYVNPAEGPLPNKGVGVPNVFRPDITDLGSKFSEYPSNFIEIKFPTDRYRGDQRQNYESLSKWYAADLIDIDLKKNPPDCACTVEEKRRQPAPVTLPQDLPSTTSPPPPIIVPPLPLPGKFGPAGALGRLLGMTR